MADNYRIRPYVLMITILIPLGILAILLHFTFPELKPKLLTSWESVNRNWDLVKPTDIWLAVNGTMQLLLLILGAWIGYVRFMRRREMHASCDFTVEAKLVSISSGHALSVTAFVKNAGSYKLAFREGTQQYVQVSCADKEMWETSNGKIRWSEGDQQVQGLLLFEGKIDKTISELEPGQRLARSLLFPVDPTKHVALRILVYVEACPRWIAVVRPAQPWSTEIVLTLGEEEAKTNGRRSRAWLRRK